MSQYYRILKKTKLLEIRKFSKLMNIDLSNLSQDEIYRTIERKSRQKDFLKFIENSTINSKKGKFIKLIYNIIDGPIRRTLLILGLIPIILGVFEAIKSNHKKIYGEKLEVKIGESEFGFRVKGLNNLTEITNRFTDKAKLNILIIPTKTISKCKNEELNVNESIIARIQKVEQELNLPIDIKIEEIENSKSIFSVKSARIIGQMRNADLVYWSEIENRCNWDTTTIYSHCVNVNLHGTCLGEFNFHEENKISKLSNILYDGVVTNSIEQLSLYGLGLKSKCLGENQEALNYFNTLLSREHPIEKSIEEKSKEIIQDILVSINQ